MNFREEKKLTYTIYDFENQTGIFHVLLALKDGNSRNLTILSNMITDVGRGAVTRSVKLLYRLKLIDRIASENNPMEQIYKINENGLKIIPYLLKMNEIIEQSKNQ